MDRQALKQNAKVKMRESRQPNLFLITLVYVLIILILDQISVNVMNTYNSFLNLDRETSLMQFFFNAANKPIYMDKFIAANKSMVETRIVEIFFFFAVTVLIWTIDFGYKIYALGVVRGQKMGIWSLFEGFNYFIKCILLKVIIGIFMIIGSLFFVIPGIVIGCMYGQAFYILLDHPEKSVRSCLAESRNIMRGHKMDYFILTLTFIGWYLLALLPYYLGYIALIWVVPYTQLTYASYYTGLISDNLNNYNL